MNSVSTGSSNILLILNSHAVSVRHYATVQLQQCEPMKEHVADKVLSSRLGYRLNVLAMGAVQRGVGGPTVQHLDC